MEFLTDLPVLEKIFISLGCLMSVVILLTMEHKTIWTLGKVINVLALMFLYDLGIFFLYIIIKIW